MISDDSARARLHDVTQSRRPCPRHDDTGQMNSCSATVQPHGISRAVEAKEAIRRARRARRG